MMEEYPGDGGSSLALQIAPSLLSLQGLKCPDILMVGDNLSLLLDEQDLQCHTHCYSSLPKFPEYLR